MIDIHTHILPNVDDGSPNLIQSIKMLKQAEDDGIKGIVCTPHVLRMNDFENEGMYFRQYEELKKMAREEGITVDIYLGAEIYITPELKLESRMATLNNNGTYFLVEFPMASIPRFAAEMFFQFIASGKIPIIAHPERNLGFLQHPEYAFEFVNRGALMQVNAGSLRGRFGQDIKKLAHTLLDHNLAHFVGSDCHDVERRKCQLKKTYDLVAEKWGHETAEQLFVKNVQSVLNGETFSTPIGIPIEFKREGFFSQLIKGFTKFRK